VVTLPKTEYTGEESLNLNHLHRYYEGCWVKEKLDPVLGNEEARLAVPLSWLLCGNGTIVRGESGSAKTKIMNAVVALVFGDDGLDNEDPMLFVVGSGSAKAPFTPQKAREIARARFCYIPEWQNAVQYEWMFKLWLENRSAPYSRAIHGGQDVETFNLRPLPIMTSLAEGNEEMPELSNEMKRRLVSFYTRSDIDLNRRVHEMKAHHRMAPDEDLVTLEPADTDNLRERLLHCMDFARKVKNPGADLSRHAVPTKYTISNTFIDYWFDLVEGVAKFYYPERPQTHKYLFATPGDNYVAYLLVSDVIRDLALGIPPLGNEILEFLPVSESFGILKADTRHDARHVDQIVDYLDEQGMPRSKTVTKASLERLVGAGFVKIDDDKRYYKTRETSAENGTNVIDWGLLMDSAPDYTKAKYPEIAVDYEDMSDTYIDPFDGRLKDIPRRSKIATPKKSEGFRNL